MKLTVIGCAGSYPSAESPASCYLLEHDGSRIVLDMGNGSLGALQQHLDLVWPGALDAVVLSHCHVDHCVDLASLFVQRHYGPDPVDDRLLVLGPTDARERLLGIYGKPESSAMEDEFDFRAFGRGPVPVGPFTIEAVRAAHPVEAYCIRVSAGGSSVTYSGDTGPNPRLVDLARGTDVALFEASFVGTDNPADLHMSGADAGRAATESGAGMLVLTHHVAWNDAAVVLAEARTTFDGPIEQATPGMVITC